MSAALIGVGLYTPAQAARLTGIGAGKIARWLRGHQAGGVSYEALWQSQVDLEDGHVYLGFRDLMETRVVDAFIRHGISARSIRRAIRIAQDQLGIDHPLSTRRFRTDGRTIFIDVCNEDGTTSLIDLFRSQYAFRQIIEPSLKNIEFDSMGAPARWWPLGRESRILVDPGRSFGRPIEAVSGIPAELLANAVEAEGSVEAAARAWDVPVASVRRALAFHDRLDLPQAA